MEGSWIRVRGCYSCDCSILSSLDRPNKVSEYRIYLSTTKQFSIELCKTKKTKLSLWAVKKVPFLRTNLSSKNLDRFLYGATFNPAFLQRSLTSFKKRFSAVHDCYWIPWQIQLRQVKILVEKLQGDSDPGSSTKTLSYLFVIMNFTRHAEETCVSKSRIVLFLIVTFLRKWSDLFLVALLMQNLYTGDPYEGGKIS